MSGITEALNTMIVTATAQAQAVGQQIASGLSTTLFAIVAAIVIIMTLIQLLTSTGDLASAAFTFVKKILVLFVCLWGMQNWVGGYNLANNVTDIKNGMSTLVLSAPGGIGV